MDYFKEHLGEILVLAAFVLYIIGILNLSMLESPIFLFCGYMGTILLVGGVLTRFEAFPTRSGFMSPRRERWANVQIDDLQIMSANEHYWTCL